MDFGDKARLAMNAPWAGSGGFCFFLEDGVVSFRFVSVFSYDVSAPGQLHRAWCLDLFPC